MKRPEFALLSSYAIKECKASTPSENHGFDLGTSDLIKGEILDFCRLPKQNKILLQDPQNSVLTELKVSDYLFPKTPIAPRYRVLSKQQILHIVSFSKKA